MTFTLIIIVVTNVCGGGDGSVSSGGRGVLGLPRLGVKLSLFFFFFYPRVRAESVVPHAGGHAPDTIN